MKKSLLIMFGIVSLLIDANAQKGFHAGVKVSPQTVWMINKELSDDPFFHYRNQYRVSFGAAVDYHFSDRAGVGLEFIYSPQGQGFAICEDCDKELIKVNYFKLPLLINWNGDPEKVAMFVGSFGPQFMFLTNAEWDGVDATEAYKKFVMSLVLGVGVGFNITDFLVATAMLRLDAGLTDAGEEGYWDNQVWALTGGTLEVGLKYVLRTGKGKR